MSYTRITFSNGRTFNTPLAPIGDTATYQSAHRNTLDIRIPSDVISFEDLCANFYTNTDATKQITVTEYEEATEEITAQSVHLNYTLPMELSFKTVDGVGVYTMRLAQMSALEIAQAKQADDIATNEAALIELAEIIAGGTE